MRRNTLKPLVLDLAKNDKDLRAQLRGDSQIQTHISPVVALVNHGLDKLLQATCRSFVSDHGSCLDASGAECLEDVQVKAEMKNLSWRVADILGVGEGVKQQGCFLDGPLNMRFYSFNEPAKSVSLGAHVDANLFTLLWQSTPGLQVVVDIPNRTIEASDVISFGIPSIGPVRQVVDEGNWATVQAPEDAIILTFGREWYSSFAQRILPVRCPVLHRVKLDKPQEQQEYRFSIPFLVRMMPNET